MKLRPLHWALLDLMHRHGSPVQIKSITMREGNGAVSTRRLYAALDQLQSVGFARCEWHAQFKSDDDQEHWSVTTEGRQRLRENA